MSSRDPQSRRPPATAPAPFFLHHPAPPWALLIDEHITSADVKSAHHQQRGRHSCRHHERGRQICAPSTAWMSNLRMFTGNLQTHRTYTKMVDSPSADPPPAHMPLVG